MQGPLSHPIVRNSMRAWVKRTSIDFAKAGPMRVFVTGGTGFFGSWVLASIRELREQGFDIQVDALARNPAKFLTSNPEYTKLPGFRFLRGDVVDSKMPHETTHVLHLATTPTDQGRDDLGLRRTVVDGTRNILDEAERVGVSGFLMASSGAVYGSKNSDRARERDFPPSWAIGFTASDVSAYGAAKREAEKMCWERAPRLRTTVARAFAFSGPLFPVDAPYALSNFMMSLVRGETIDVRSPETIRTYLDGQDLVDALWRILLTGKAGAAYNVGSSESTTMRDLAKQIQRLSETLLLRPLDVQVPPSATSIAGPADAYRPAISVLQNELGWKPFSTLAESLESQAKWTLNSSTN